MIKKYLPISENVRFRTYSYYSYYDAVVSNECRTGKVAAVVSIDGYDETIWKKEEKRLHVVSSGQGNLVFESEKYNFSMEAFVYRPLLMCDEQIIEIKYQQQSQPWGSIGLFVSDTISYETSMYEHQIGHFCTGDIFYKNRGQQDNHGCLGQGKCIIQMKKSGKEILFSAYDEKRGVMETLQRRECYGKDLYLGVYVYLYDNCYYNWMFSNYFQLKANTKADDIFLEFDNALKRDWKYFTTNYFIDYNVVSNSLLKKLSINICHYIRENINEEKYIEMDIDHYDVEGTDSYQKRHMKHTCLFFGYNDLKESLYLLCVDGGLIKKGKISYECILNQFSGDNCETSSENENMIITETYMPEKANYTMDKGDIVRFAKAFLNGTSLSGGGVVLPSDGNYVYGIEIYDYLRQNVDIVIDDIRISHLLVEHKQCMMERIEYMTLKEMIDEKDAAQLNVMVEDMLKTAKVLRNKILRNKVLPHELIGTSVDKYLLNIKEMELKLMKFLCIV